MLTIWARSLMAGALALTCTVGGAAPTPSGRLSPTQQRKIAELIETSRQMQRGHDPVKAYLYLREAFRLEQLWSNNTFGDEMMSQQHLERLTREVTRRDDDSLMKILHSKEVSLNDKLGLLRVLEQEIILNYPGRTGDALLSTGAYEN